MPIDEAGLLEELKTMKYLGVTKGQYQDRTLTYRSLEEINQIIAELETKLGLRSGRARRKVISTDKGFGGETGGVA